MQVNIHTYTNKGMLKLVKKSLWNLTRIAQTPKPDPNLESAVTGLNPHAQAWSKGFVEGKAASCNASLFFWLSGRAKSFVGEIKCKNANHRISKAGSTILFLGLRKDLLRTSHIYAQIQNLKIQLQPASHFDIKETLCDEKELWKYWDPNVCLFLENRR